MFVLTVIIRFSAQGAYLLLVHQERSLIQTRALISFWETVECAEKSFDVYFKKKRRLKNWLLVIRSKDKNDHPSTNHHKIATKSFVSMNTIRLRRLLPNLGHKSFSLMWPFLNMSYKSFFATPPRATGRSLQSLWLFLTWASNRFICCDCSLTWASNLSLCRNCSLLGPPIVLFAVTVH